MLCCVRKYGVHSPTLLTVQLIHDITHHISTVDSPVGLSYKKKIKKILYTRKVFIQVKRFRRKKFKETDVTPFF